MARKGLIKLTGSPSNRQYALIDLDTGHIIFTSPNRTEVHRYATSLGYVCS